MKQSSPAPALSELPSAGLFRRLAAAVYDLLILIAVWFLVAFVHLATTRVIGITSTGPLLQATLFPLLLAATAGFYGWFWTHGGQTLGMRAWKLKVVHASLTGAPVTWVQCLLRCLGGALSWSAFGLGYLWVYADASRDTWHDRLSGTRTLVIPKTMM